MPKRTLNYTGRRRINQSRIRISLVESERPPMSFQVDELNLNEMGLPPYAHVYVEAYRRSTYMRFPWGTVQNPAPPADTRLADIDSADRVYFRIKVIADSSADDGLILAQADRIGVDRSSAGSVTILPVSVRDLDNVVWRLNLESEEPMLEVNSRVNGIEERVRSDRMFAALVFPSLISSVLTYIAKNELEANGEDGQWVGNWLRFARILSGEDMPENDDFVEQWVDDVVEAFATRHQLRQSYQEATNEYTQAQ